MALLLKKISKKDRKIQERALRIHYNDVFSDCESILNKSGKSTMEVKRLRTLVLEVYETLNNMNPEYMKKIFPKTAFTTHRHLNFEVNKNHTSKYGNKYVWVLIFGTPSQIKLKKKSTTLSARNLLTTGLT